MNRYLHSKYLAIIAFLAWFASLWSIALVSYTGDVIHGNEILFLGWILIFDGNVAWYANPLLLIILFSLIFHDPKSLILKRINIAMFFTIAFALNTLTLSTFYPMSQTKLVSPLYGYGLGFILWCISILISLIAVSKKNQAVTDHQQSKNIAKAIEYIGWFTIIFMIFGSFYLHYEDNKYANSFDKERLQTAIFKRIKICSCEPKIKSTKSIGIIEVIQPTTDYDIDARKTIYMFNSPLKLLEWGVPIVRINGMDYSLKKQSNETLLTATRASGQAKFQLIISEVPQGIRTIIKSFESNNSIKDATILTDQIWKLEAKTGDIEAYCPEFVSNPSPNQYPRKMIYQALNLKNPALKNEVQSISPQHVEANISHTFHLVEQKNNYLDNGSQSHSFYNDCPTNVYMDINNSLISSSLANLIGNRPMSINGTDYFPVERFFKSIDMYSCDKNSLYLYTEYGHNIIGEKSSNEIKFMLQKRSIKDYSLEWSKEIHYDGKYFFKGAKYLRAYEKDKKVFIELYDNYLNEVIVINIQK